MMRSKYEADKNVQTGRLILAASVVLVLGPTVAWFCGCSLGFVAALTPLVAIGTLGIPLGLVETLL